MWNIIYIAIFIKHRYMGKQKPNGYWNDKQNCLDEAHKYIKRSYFKRKSNGAYEACVRNGWLDEICQHMIKQPNGSFRWDYDSCMDVALKCENIKEFKSKYSGAYGSSQKNGWLDDMNKHMVRSQKPHGYWTLENVMIEAQKFSSRKEFGDNSEGGAYGAAQRNGWLGLISKHMKIKGCRYKRLVYVYEFEDRSAYIGLTYNIDVRQAQRDNSKCDQVTKYINKTGLTPIRKELSGFVDSELAGKLECEYIETYRKDGWNVLNVSRGGNMGGDVRKWTKEYVIEVVNELRYYHIIKGKYPHFFSIIKKFKYDNVLDELLIIVDGIELKYCEYHKLNTIERNNLLKTKYLEIISQYNNVADFKNDHKLIYNTILKRRGWDKLIKSIGYVKPMKHGATNENGKRIYPKSRYRQYQDIELVKSEILKYSTYTELCEKDGVLAMVIRDNNWGDDLLKELHGNKPQQYISSTKFKEKYIDIISRYVNFIDFNRDHNWEYQSIVRNNWIELFDKLKFYVNDMVVDYNIYIKCKNDSVFKTIFIKSEYLKIVSKYSELNKFKSENITIYNYIMRQKWGGELFINLTRENKIKLHKYDDKEFVINELKKYKTFTDLRNKNFPLLNRIRKNGWEDELLCEINKTKVRLNDWDFENCSKVAKQYRSRSEFKLNNGAAFGSARKNGWLDDICSHMLTENQIRIERKLLKQQTLINVSK